MIEHDDPQDAATQARRIAPWTIAEVTLMNQFQVGVSPVGTGLVRTCPHRATRAHGKEGGEPGVLVATVAGWMCPDCRYTREWEDAAWIARACGRAGGQPARRITLKTVRDRLTSYVDREAAGGPAVTGMIDSLREREDALSRAGEVWRPRGLHGLLGTAYEDAPAMERSLAELLDRTQAALAAWHERTGQRRPAETDAVAAFKESIATFATHLRGRSEREGEPE